MKLILASASPRRSELLRQLGVVFQCDPAEIDESPQPDERPEDYVARMAREKAEAVSVRYPDADAAVLAADTTVVMAGEILGKPRDHFHGLSMLERLSGRTHSVFTAIWLTGPSGSSGEVVATRVSFLPLTRRVCEAYLATEEPWDKAGAYGIQGLGGAFVRSIEGSYSNVVGLPLSEAWQLLAANGVETVLGR
jgi:septum formation protein